MSSARKNMKKIQKISKKLEQVQKLLDELELSAELDAGLLNEESEEVDVDYSPDMDIVVARARNVVAKEKADFPGASIESKSESEGPSEAEGFMHDL